MNQPGDKSALDALNDDNPFKLETVNGFATKIFKSGWAVLDLNPSCRNEECQDKIIELLNSTIGQPKWTKDTPNEPGMYWNYSEQYSCPIIVCIYKSQTGSLNASFIGTSKTFTITRLYEATPSNNHQWWMKIKTPELPKE